MNLSLSIVLQKPPANIAYALQKGSGNAWETVQVQLSKGADLYFDLTIEIKGDKQKDQFPLLRGPFVQGPPMGKFIYLDIGAMAGQQNGWRGRLKIPLSGITWEMIDQLNERPNSSLETSVPGIGKKGGPNCAMVKPFDGWQVKTA